MIELLQLRGQLWRMSGHDYCGATVTDRQRRVACQSAAGARGMLKGAIQMVAGYEGRLGVKRERAAHTVFNSESKL